MLPFFSSTKILKDQEFNDLMFKGNIDNLDSFINFDNGMHLVVSNPDQEALLKYNPSNYSNVNIAIASAITAYARIIMSQFMNHPDFDLYYTDTDSIIVGGAYASPEKMNSLFNDIIGNKLGQLKLEHTIDKAVFLSPKSYFLCNDKGETIVKMKGLKAETAKTLSFDDFVMILEKDQYKMISQIKMKKNLSKGTLNLLEQLYTIKHNGNKRQLIYNNHGILINTSPKIMNVDKA